MYSFNKIPPGGIYYLGILSTTVGDYKGYKNKYTFGDSFPDDVQLGDVFIYGDYQYKYGYMCLYEYPVGFYWLRDDDEYVGWGVRVLDDSKTSYGEILNDICGKFVIDLSCTFALCKNLVHSPKIPNNVKYMNNTFNGCISLISAPSIPDSVECFNSTFHSCISLKEISILPDGIASMRSTFFSCRSLTLVHNIPSGVTDMYNTFYGCSSLKEVSEIPNGVVTLFGTFRGCISLITPPPVIPNTVKDMTGTFYSCEHIQGKIIVHANPDSYFRCFYMAGKYGTGIDLTGSSILLDSIANTGDFVHCICSNC